MEYILEYIYIIHQSAGMWWICDGELNLKCISVSFANKSHCNRDALFFFSGKLWISMHGGIQSMCISQSNNLVLDFW